MSAAAERAREDLAALYIEQTTKVAVLSAALGLHGDAPAGELAAKARRIAQERSRLLAAAEVVIADSCPSDHGGRYVRVNSIEKLSAVVTAVKAP